MAWLELHQTRARHPKTLRLASLLGQDRRYVCGLLDDLWSWGLDVADRNGWLCGLTAEEIAVAMDYPAKKGKWLMDALVSSGYVDVDADETFRLHDWDIYAGKLNDRREKDADRKRTTRRQNAECPQHVRRTSDGCPGATVPIPYHNDDHRARAREEDDVVTDEEVMAATELNLAVSEVESAAQGIGLTVATKQVEMISLYLADYPKDWILQAICETAKADRPSWRYIEGVLKNWRERGGPMPQVIPRGSPRDSPRDNLLAVDAGASLPPGHVKIISYDDGTFEEVPVT